MCIYIGFILENETTKFIKYILQMPEIAEVALMADYLKELAFHAQITSIKVIGGRYHCPHGEVCPNLANGGSPCRYLPLLDTLSAKLPLTLSQVQTKGKKCWLELKSQDPQVFYILISFGMSGMIRTNVDPKDQKHLHIEVQYSRNGDEDIKSFYFMDMRHFGSWQIFLNHQDLDQVLNEIGPDLYLMKEEEFVQALRQPRLQQRNICKILMEQKAVSGVGNYIKSEALYHAKISPWAIPLHLTDTNLKSLYQSLRYVAISALQLNGASLYTYLGINGEAGDYQYHLQVYQKEVVDDHAVESVKTPDNRTTHWVPTVQTIGVIVPVPQQKIPNPVIIFKEGYNIDKQ
jgi:DNA-formamidopyrimidine glycosylase